MLYLSGVVRPDLPAMVTPRMGQKPAKGQLWAADNGRFSAPQNYSDEKYLAWLSLMPRAACLFATAPDVVGDAEATLELSWPMFRRINRVGYAVALVAQDGLTPAMVPWHEIDCLFIGGTTKWKLGPEVPPLVEAAIGLRKWVHMGRVNSWRRIEHARAIGCDSVDGTYLAYDARPEVVHDWVKRAHMNPHIWRVDE